MKIFILLISICVIVSSCKKTSSKDQAKIDNEIIQKYIGENKLSATSTSNGLYYVIENQGSGTKPNSYSQVQVAYKGYLTDGTVFDQSNSSGAVFNLQSVIKGWTEGIPYFKAGGNGKLLIPSALGYGPNGTTGIPGNSVLIFDIKVIKVL